MSEATDNKYLGTLMPAQYKKVFQDNPDTLDIMAVFMVDLFRYGQNPAQQAQANKGREMLEILGILKFPDEANGSPSLESLKELLRKMLS